eukprot:6610619-Heterocapsa_arctica.AAC.1
MPQGDQPPGAPLPFDPWQEQTAEQKAASKPLEARGQCYAGTGYWERSRDQWMGMQPPTATDPSSWEDRRGEQWTQGRNSGSWQTFVEGTSSGSAGQPQ